MWSFLDYQLFNNNVGNTVYVASPKLSWHKIFMNFVRKFSLRENTIVNILLLHISVSYFL